jgi:hypothetical protein
MKKIILLNLIIILSSCANKMKIKEAELFVPEFIQKENPDIYKKFK